MDVNKKGQYQKPDETPDAIADKKWRQEHGIMTSIEALEGLEADVDRQLKETEQKRSKSDT
jgi:hypothetical protein